MKDALGQKRPDWESYFLKIAGLAATRSTCLRRQVGAVLVKEKNILSTGYNGAPSGVPHCVDVGCLREQEGIPSGQRHELCRGLHAEQNAIIQAATFGVSIRGSTLYSTHQPCSVCAKMIVNAGIEKIVNKEGYPDGLARQILDEAGIDIQLFRADV